MKIDFIGFVDFGGKGTLKTHEFLAVIKAVRPTYVNKILVRKKSRKVKKSQNPLPLGSLLPKTLTFINKYILEKFNSRKISFSLFDFFASKKISSDANILYSLTSGFPKTYRKAKKNGTKVVAQINVAHTNYNNNIKKREAKIWGFKPDIKPDTMTNKDIDFFFVISDFIKGTFIVEKVPESKIKTIPYGGYDHKLKKPLFKRKNLGKVRFLFIGNEWIIKGIPYLLEAWKELSLKDAELILVGIPGKEFDEIKDKFDYTNVKLVGYAPPERYYCSSSVVIFPTLSDGRSKVVPEALSYGLPVITTKNDGSADLIEDGKNGFVIDPANKNEIKKKIIYFYKNRRKINEMGKNASKKIKSCTWNNTLKKIGMILEGL